MPILVQTIADEMASALDANPPVSASGSDYYQFDLDYKPAINFAIDEIVRMVNDNLGSDKFTEEAFRELVEVQMYQTSLYSRVSIPDTIWSIISVMGDPTTDPAKPTITVVGDKVSLLRPDIYFVGSLDTANRYSSEEYAINRGNPFSPAYSGETRNLGNFGYKSITNYSLGSKEIEISPYVKKGIVGLELVVNPTRVSLITDSLTFPQSLFNFIMNLSLFWMSRKMGDGTTIASLSMNEIQAQAKTYGT